MIKFGNTKLPHTTMIFNLCPALTCPSAANGTCDNVGICYARATEKRWHSVFNKRLKQEEFYSTQSAEDIATYFIMQIKIRRMEGHEVNSIRFSEAGDFKNQKQVDKFTKIFKQVKEQLPEIVIYGYTSRKDLDFFHMMQYAVVQGSGFMLSNNFVIVEEIDKSKPYCSGKCTDCNLCLFSERITIQVKRHR